MQDALKKFGRYFLLDMIAQGGMAEIFRARQITTEGLGRMLVIKRIQPSYGTNNEFVTMFQSETRVMMNFNHPNVVQLQDFGEEQNQPFIAMEYIEGKSLRFVKDRIVEKMGQFPPDLAAYIISQAAAGLYYAHSFKDKLDGRPLNLVHRDISPQNIILSYDSNVKIIDFGIAKASTNSEQTRAGVIKGKPSYLSPEQIDPGTGTLDGRSDIFSLGIVFWELLTGRKLFAGDNDLATLRLIQNCDRGVRPPSEFNKLVSKDLDYIVMQALAKNRDQRFANALELERKLRRYLVGFNPDFNPVDQSNELKQLFANEIVDDRKNLQRLNEKATHILSLLTTEETSEIVRGDRSGKEELDTQTGIALPLKIESSGARTFESTQVDLRQVQVDAPRAQSRPITAGRQLQQASRATTTGQSAGRGAPPRAMPTAKPSSSNNFLRVVASAAAIVGAYVLLYGGKPGGMRTPSSKPASVTSEKPVLPPDSSLQRTASSKEAVLQLRINPSGGRAKIRVNGKPISSAGDSIRIPEGGEVAAFVDLEGQYRVEIEVPGFKHKLLEGAVDASRLQAGTMGREFSMPVELEPEVFGILKYKSATATANLRVEIGGQSWVYWSNTPGGYEIVKLPPATYRLQFFSLFDMGQIVDGVNIEQGQTQEVEVSLKPMNKK